MRSDDVAVRAVVAAMDDHSCRRTLAAERMVLELRDKLPAATGEEPSTPQAESLSPVDQDVLSALLNLGCARPQAAS